MGNELFRVISQREILDVSGPGSARRAMEITFEALGANAVGTLVIPWEDYRVELVRERITEAAERMNAVAAL